MTADPSSAPPGAAVPGPSWEATLAGGGRARGPLTAPRRRSARPRHEAGEADAELRSQADWRLNAWLASVLVAVVTVVGGTCWVTLRSMSDPETPPGSTTAAAEAADEVPEAGSNVVFVLTDGGGATVAAAVMGADAKRATCVLTPRRLVLDVHGRPTPLSSAFAASERDATAAVGDTLGVRVDGSWTLSSSGLVKLVDSLDGVKVDTRIGIGPKGEVEESGGPRDMLRGAAAADFAMHPPKGSAEALKLARFHAVIDGVILALPDDLRAQRAAVAGLGTEIESSLPDDQFARFLGDLHRHAKAGHVDDQMLPVVRSRDPRPGGYDLDAARFEQLLKGPLAHVRRPVKVLVQGDGESAKTADAVRSRLEQAQLDYVAGASTTSGGPAVEKKTTVLATGDSPSDLNRAREVAAALGVPVSSIVTQEIIDAAYDVLVQLGADLEALLRRAGLTPTATPA